MVDNDMNLESHIQLVDIVKEKKVFFKIKESLFADDQGPSCPTTVPLLNFQNITHKTFVFVVLSLANCAFVNCDAASS